MSKGKKVIAKAGPRKSQLQIEFTDKELKLLKETIAPDSTEAEFNFFVYDCQARGLNPLKKEMHFIKRMASYKDESGAWKKKAVASHQVGIDGFRIIAQKSGEYEGQTRPVYAEKMIKWAGLVMPEYAEIGVYRAGFKEPLYARAYFQEYCQTDRNGNAIALWKKMPRLMLAKCAEALALRKAFPDSLSGLYTDDEMSQANEPVKKEVNVLVSKDTLDRFVANFKQIAEMEQWGDEKKKTNYSKLLNGKDLKRMSEKDVKLLADKLEKKIETLLDGDKQVEVAKEIFESEVVEETGEVVEDKK